MKGLKITIYIIFILIIIITVSLVILNKVNTNGNSTNANNISDDTNVIEEYSYDSSYNGGNSYKINESIVLLDSPTIYFSVKSIVDNYFENIDKLDLNNIKYEMRLEENDDAIKEEQEFIISILKTMITEDYKYDNLDVFEKYINTSYEIKNIYTKDKDKRISIYFVEGHIKELKEDYNLIVITDTNNATFTIYPSQYILQKYGDIKFKDEIMETEVTEIQNKYYNKFRYTNVTEEQMVREYFNNYKYLMQTDIEKAYSLLNQEYKEKKFKSLNSYNDYITKNMSTIENAKPSQYLIKERDGYTEYAILDTYGNYYIFQETSTMKYTVILDTYTIDIPEFLEKYNKADEEIKVKMNITRFFEAIKSSDYEYAYEKLDETFKQQYFTTLAEFENYAKTIFIYDEDVLYNDFSDLDGIYTYTVSLENGENTVEKTITIKLLEGTDYRISFDV